jgi:carboxylate-amine ligase
MDHAFTVGVEEEFQIIDPDTWELRSHVSELLVSGAPALGDQLKRELHQSIVEVGTKICANIQELEDEIYTIRRELADSAERVGLRIAAAGTHPFSNWKDQIISPGERYENIVEELQQLARSLLIFGLHIHVAVPDRTSTIELLNEARYFLPHLLALSTSSPFWQGRDTGLKSYRTTVFRRFPRSGIPDQFDSWSEYEEYLTTLVQLHCIDNAKKVWWDLRPHPTFGTLEFRICDVPTSPRVTIALAAVAQAIVVKLYRLRRKNLGFRIYSRALVEENKWRAARYGLDAVIILDADSNERLVTEDLDELLNKLEPVAKSLDCSDELAQVADIYRSGASYQRQRRVAEENDGDLRAVVDALVAELDI